MDKEGICTDYQIISREDPAIAEYSAFVWGHANGHFLQSPNWAAVKYWWQWCGIVVRKDNGMIAAAMSILYRRLPLGLSFAYAPRGPVCDRNDETVIRVLTAGLQDFAKKNKCLLTYLDPDEKEENTEFCSIMQSLGFVKQHSDAFGGIQPHSVFRISLEGKAEDKLLASFAQKTRYNIRLAQRRGVTISRFPGNGNIPQEILDSFDALMQTTGKRDHFIVRNREYFEKILKAMSNDAVLYMAYLHGTPIAGTIGIYHGGKAWYLYGASANEHRGAMPNYLLQWNMMREALQRKCTVYDLRGVPGTREPDDPLYGLYRFKKGFGGTHTRFAGLFTFYHRPILGRFFDFLQKIFRKLRRT